MGRQLIYYDLYDDEGFIGKYSAKELSDMFGISPGGIPTYYKRKQKIRRKYRIELGIPDDFRQEWPKACERFRKARGLDHVHDCHE